MQRQSLTTIYKTWKHIKSSHLSGATALSKGPSRSFCQQGASIEEKHRSLKSQLRSLYKKIHPDLFHNEPSFRETNEKSFQVLQEYLAAAQSGSGIHDRAPPQLYKFEFYIRQVQENEVEATEKVDVVLPPPQRARSSGGELPVGTRMAIGRLLEACGLSSNVSGGLRGAEKVRLGDLFQQASEIQRNYSSESLTAERHSIVVRNALRMGRGVFPSFREPLADASIERQLAALERLIECLDKVPHLDLGGCTMVIGKGYGVDALGNVWLDHQDEAEGWAHWLPQADIQGAHDRRMAARERRGREALTASDMEVEMIYTDNLIAVSKEYSDFLTRMAEGAQANGGVGGGAYFDLPLRVVRPADGCEESYTEFSERRKEERSDKEGCTAPYHVDEHMGYVTVPVDATLTDLYDFIRKRGSEALRIRRRYRNEEQRLIEMKVHVRQKLRLRNLACDKKIGNDQFMSACARMLRHAPELQRHMEGLYVCISDEHRLPISTGTFPVVHLKWNFSLDDL